MIDLNDEQIDAINKLFTDMVGLINESGLSRLWVQSVLAKVIVLNALGENSKDEFLERMGYVFDFESQLRPESKEIH